MTKHKETSARWSLRAGDNIDLVAREDSVVKTDRMIAFVEQAADRAAQQAVSKMSGQAAADPSPGPRLPERLSLNDAAVLNVTLSNHAQVRLELIERAPGELIITAIGGHPHVRPINASQFALVLRRDD